MSLRQILKDVGIYNVLANEIIGYYGRGQDIYEDVVTEHKCVITQSKVLSNILQERFGEKAKIVLDKYPNFAKIYNAFAFDNIYKENKELVKV